MTSEQLQTYEQLNRTLDSITRLREQGMNLSMSCAQRIIAEIERLIGAPSAHESTEPRTNLAPEVGDLVELIGEDTLLPTLKKGDRFRIHGKSFREQSSPGEIEWAFDVMKLPGDGSIYRIPLRFFRSVKS